MKQEAAESREARPHHKRRSRTGIPGLQTGEHVK